MVLHIRQATITKTHQYNNLFNFVQLVEDVSTFETDVIFMTKNETIEDLMYNENECDEVRVAMGLDRPHCVIANLSKDLIAVRVSNTGNYNDIQQISNYFYSKYTNEGKEKEKKKEKKKGKKKGKGKETKKKMDNDDNKIDLQFEKTGGWKDFEIIKPFNIESFKQMSHDRTNIISVINISKKIVVTDNVAYAAQCLVYTSQHSLTGIESIMNEYFQCPNEKYHMVYEAGYVDEKFSRKTDTNETVFCQSNNCQSSSENINPHNTFFRCNNISCNYTVCGQCLIKSLAKEKSIANK